MLLGPRRRCCTAWRCCTGYQPPSWQASPRRWGKQVARALPAMALVRPASASRWLLPSRCGHLTPRRLCRTPSVQASKVAAVLVRVFTVAIPELQPD